MSHDLVIRGGTILTASESCAADVGIVGESIADIGDDLQGAREIDATGRGKILKRNWFSSPPHAG